MHDQQSSNLSKSREGAMKGGREREEERERKENLRACNSQGKEA